MESWPEESSRGEEGSREAVEPDPVTLDEDHFENLDIEIIAKVAQGGMGVVFRARQRFLNRVVALKVSYFPEDVEDSRLGRRFSQEAKRLASLLHPGIVACYQAGLTSRGQQYLVMEFIEGPNLRTYIADRGPLGEREALLVVRKLAVALQYALEHNTIHCDLKPENVLLAPVSIAESQPELCFEPKLSDLGLARRNRFDISDEDTLSDGFAGTPHVMAPEQLENRDVIDFRADVYAMGCLLYFMLSGQLPFTQNNIPAIHKAKVSEDFTPVRDHVTSVSRGTEKLIAGLLAAKPEKRPESYQHLIDQVDGLLGSLPQQGEASAQPQNKQKSSKLLVPILAIVVIALVVVVAGPSLLRSKGSEAPAASPPAESGLRAASEVTDTGGSVPEAPTGEGDEVTIGESGLTAMEVSESEPPAAQNPAAESDGQVPAFVDPDWDAGSEPNEIAAIPVEADPLLVETAIAPDGLVEAPEIEEADSVEVAIAFTDSRLGGFLPPEPKDPIPSGIVLNEIMVLPRENDTALEYYEIKTAFPGMNLDGHSLLLVQGEEGLLSQPPGHVIRRIDFGPDAKSDASGLMLVCSAKTAEVFGIEPAIQISDLKLLGDQAVTVALMRSENAPEQHGSVEDTQIPGAALKDALCLNGREKGYHAYFQAPRLESDTTVMAAGGIRVDRPESSVIGGQVWMPASSLLPPTTYNTPGRVNEVPEALLNSNIGKSPLAYLSDVGVSPPTPTATPEPAWIALPFDTLRQEIDQYHGAVIYFRDPANHAVREFERTCLLNPDVLSLIEGNPKIFVNIGRNDLSSLKQVFGIDVPPSLAVYRGPGTVESIPVTKSTNITDVAMFLMSAGQ